MTTMTKLGAFIVGLAVVLVGALGVGNLVGPLGEQDEKPESHHAKAPGSGKPGAGGHGGHGGSDSTAKPAAAEAPPGGLQVSERGYTLQLDRPTLAQGRTEVGFRVLGPNGKPLTTYQREHDKDLHLIVVKRDLSGFQHVHPTRDAKGRWSIDVSLTPGTWRVFADFKPKGQKEGLTLGADVSVPGQTTPKPLPEQARTTTVDGYTVTLKGGLVAGKDALLTLSVSKNGRPVTDLQPYLGAYGHLFALRDGDLGYLHVHPDGEPGDGKTKAGPQVAFHATAPSRGAYRLYLDFKHGDVVRTAEFTVRTAGTTAPAPAASSSGHADDGHSH
jgi:hypothetical protein